MVKQEMSSGISVIYKNFKIKAPTCEMFEPNFVKVFTAAQDHCRIENKNVITENRIVIASLWENQPVYDVKKGVKGAESNQAYVHILVKNPSKQYGQLFGLRNGLTVLYNTVLAVRITDQHCYITRPVIPEYQEMFLQSFNYFLDLLGISLFNPQRIKVTEST